MSGITYPQHGTSTNMLTTLPLHERHSPIRYLDENSATAEMRYPINYEELYNLKGRLLTLIDATYTDPEQRKAQKDLVWQTLRAWMDDVAHSGQESDAISYSLKGSESTGQQAEAA